MTTQLLPKDLFGYLNIKIVSTDGSATYHNSITEAHPEAIQISNRFHLYKNLTDYSIEYFKKNVEVVINSTDIASAATSNINKNIDGFLNLGIMASKIEEIIREKGYHGSSSTILHYVSE